MINSDKEKEFTMNIDQFVKDQQTKRAANGLLVHFIDDRTGNPTFYAAADEEGKQRFIRKAKIQGRELI